MHLYSFKYIVLGNSGVGKSSIVLRLTDQRFLTTHDLTIGVDYGSKIINIRGNDIKLQIWDTAGQESFRSITRSYYRSAAGILLVYDITNRRSFLQLQQWLDEIRVENQNPSSVIMLIGNKCDINHRREVTTEEGEEFAKAKGLLFAETSARLDATSSLSNNKRKNIYDVFANIAECIYQKIETGELDIKDERNGVRVFQSPVPIGMNVANSGSTESTKGWFSCCFQ